jgi:hypothetical protein
MRRVLALAWRYPPERSRPERQLLRLDLVLERRPPRHAFGDCLVDQYSIHVQAIRFRHPCSHPHRRHGRSPAFLAAAIGPDEPHRNGLAVAVLKGT